MSNWDTIQQRQLTAHKRGDKVFSQGRYEDERILGKLINDLLAGGHCLDVGCGILPMPSYMKAAPDVTFTGIDPFDNLTPGFRYVRGKAESLPFKQEFDGVLFASTMDHIEDPRKAISEARRVLKPGGYVIIWGTFREDTDKVFRKWLKTGGIVYQHMQAYSVSTLHTLMAGFELVRVVQLKIKKHKIFIYRK